jgi:N utilization substance protein A
MPTLTNEEIQMINLLESITGAKATDAIITDNSVIFIVEKEDLGKAIGKKGNNVLRLRKVLDRDVEVIAYAPDLKEFLKSVFYPVEIKEITVSEGDKRVVTLQVDPKNKGLAIGRRGEKIDKARVLVKRYFNFDNLRIL